MRIAIYSDNFYPELSGITTTITTIGNALAARGHQIAYFVPAYSDENYRVVGLPRDYDPGKNISVFRMPASGVRTGNRQGRFVFPIGTSYSALKKFDPDVIHFHLFGGTGVEAVMMAKLFGKPLVGTDHTPILEFMHYSPIQAEWFQKLASRYNEWLYNRCDFVASPCQAIFDSMKYFNQRIPHQVVSNPIDTERFRPAVSKLAAKKKAGLPNFTILFVNKLGSEKRADTVIRAIAEIKDKITDITFALAGEGPCKAEWSALAKSLGVERNVKFFGFIPDEKLPLIYQAGDLFAIMSKAETQSISAMQALASEVPVLAANAWGLKEYIKPEVGFLIEPEDYKTLAAKILLLYQKPALRRKMGKAARKYVEGFSIENITKTWEEIYENTIKRYNQERTG
jgi:glycosyltransferase involved in cell wall biosynthesis